MLRIDDLVVRYGAVEAVNEVSLTVAPGELVALLGANGAGKTTLLRTVSGLVPANTGAITFEGIDLRATKAEAIAAAGIAHVPEGRRIFGGLSVEENLILGATTRGRDASRPRTRAASPRRPVARRCIGDRHLVSRSHALPQNPREA